MHDITRFPLDLPTNLPLEQLCERLKHAAEVTARGKRELAHFLTEMQERKLYHESGHGSTHHYALAVLGIEERATRRFLQVGRALNQLDLVRDAYEELGWSRTVKILSRVQLATQAEWIEFARNHSNRQIDEELRRTRQSDLPGEGRHGLVPVRHPVRIELTEDEHDDTEAVRKLLNRGGKILDDHELHVAMVQFCKDALADEEPDEPTTEPEQPPTDTTVPPATRDYILRRDRHECVNCGWKINLQVHHIQAREDGGGHERWNLVAFCDTCHTLVHTGKLFLSGNPENGTLIRTNRNGELVEPPLGGGGTRVPPS